MNATNFDRIARSYRFLEYLALGPALQNCRTHYISTLRDRRDALVLGDGDGRFLAALLTVNPDLRATAVDSSAGMLALLRQRCDPHSDRLRTVHQNALDAMPHATYDLITAHFFFDCLTQPELDALIPRLAALASPKAIWLISDFRIPQGPLGPLARIYVRALYFAFRLLTGLGTTQLPNHEIPLHRSGFIRTHQHLSLGGLLTTELWTSQSRSNPCR